MQNPLLEKTNLPLFSKIKPEHIEPAIDQLIAENRKKIAELLQQKPFTWENLIVPLEDISQQLDFVWSTVGHLHAVMNSESLRQAYKICLPKITEYSTEIAQNLALYAAFRAIAESSEFQKLNPVQQKIILDNLRDFKLAGVTLEPVAKHRFAQLQLQLSTAMNKFEQNVLDATQGWSKLITDKKDLAGIPELAVQAAREAAQNKNLDGWLFTLEAPSYFAVVTHADSRALREEMYHAYVTRASELGPNAGRWNNAPIIQEILQIRREIAQLLDFNNYAELSLATKTANNTDEVLNFIKELIEHSYPIAQKEFAELSQFAKQQFNLTELKSWDVSYVSEKLQQQKYDITEEQLRPYFPENQVLAGMFAVIQRLFGMHVKEKFNVDVWHPDVRFFEIYDTNHQLRGQFYLDAYARENKRGGAWMDDCRIRRRLPDGSLQTSVAFLTCNATRPVGDKPALFTHEEVQTLFHEFGHGLHQMLSQIDYAEASGINNFPWDVVEFPSQLMENWCWQKAALDLMAKHYQTSEPFPDELFKKLHTIKTFFAGMRSLRQLEFALFDFRLHHEFDPSNLQQVQQIIKEVREKLTLYTIPEFNRFQNTFTHIFGSGYAAGYYSYKWAEVWACDAFAKFEEQGIFNRAVGEQFLHTILEKGSSDEPLKMFMEFRGRPPKIDALLRHMGEYAIDQPESKE